MSDDYVCPECGLDYGTLDASGIAARIRPMGTALSERLTGADDNVIRTRPEPTVWSAVEYAAHVADAFDAFVEMVHRMRANEDVGDVFWDPDERAIEQHYNKEPVASLVDTLDAQSSRLADAFGQVSASDWRITARFPWGERDLLTMARNAVHEGVHHAQDIDRVIARVSAASG